MNVASTLPTALLTFVVLFSTTPSLWGVVRIVRNPHPQGTFLKIVDANVAESGQKSILLRRPNDDLRVVPIASLPPEDQKIIERFESGQAVDENVQGAQIEILSGKSAAQGEKYAILIGVDQYSSPFNSLDVCGNDMRLLADTFVANGFAEENVFLLTSDGTPPTKERVERLLTTLLPALSPKDAVVVAFSGHGLMLDMNGVQQSYFCPSDSELYRDSKEKTADSLVARRSVDQALLDSPARSKVLICDACRSESFQNAESSQDAPENRASQADDAETTPCFQDANFCVLSSCMPGQVSFEASRGDGDEHSVFIWFLNEGLLGYADQDPSTGGDGDGKVGVQEAFNYAQRRTRKFVELEYNSAQIPTFSGTLDDDFALTVNLCDQLPPDFQYDFENPKNNSFAESGAQENADSVAESEKDLLLLVYRLQILGFALRAYCDETGALPSARATDKNGKPTHSWRVRLLPFLGEDERALYAQIRLDEPWDGAWNS